MPPSSATTPPQIAAALDELRARVRQRFLIHGLGWVVAALAALCLAHYLLDRGLDLPRVPRLVLLFGIAVVLYRGVRRRLTYPLTRPLSQTDIALLLERNHPDLHQELVSAVQLDPERARGDSRVLIEEVRSASAARVRALDLGSVLRGERTRRVWTVAASILGVFAVVAGVSPQSFGTWCVRLFGIDRDYPRSTFLTLEIPKDQGNYRILESSGSDGPLVVQLARGAELPVHVLVEGVVPPIVELVTIAPDGSEFAVPMSRRGDRRFRTIVRRTLEPFELYARGGDDPGTRIARIEILVPPAATELTTTIEAPGYTRRAISQIEGGLVEALPGSTITLRFRATTQLASAVLEFQESQVVVEAKAEPATDPSTVDSGGTSDVEARIHVARFTMPEKADRYRLRLVAENGLTELSPSPYSVVPLPDEKPRVRIFTPAAGQAATTLVAKLPLRWHAKDDFGLARATLSFSSGAVTTTAPPVETVLFEATGDDATTALEHRDFRFVTLADLEVDGRKAQVGDRIALSLVVTDNRAPDPQSSRPQTFRLDVLDVEELQRRLQSRLRATRATVERALRVQEEQRSRSTTFLAAVDAVNLERRRVMIAATEAGQQRGRRFLLPLRNEFGESLDAHLFNGLDGSPDATLLLERYARFQQDHLELEASDPAFWVEVAAARKKGEVGRLELIGRMNDMLSLSHELLEQNNDRALRALAVASTASADVAFSEALNNVAKEQDAIAEGLARLLTMLEDWNDYQDVVRITRRLRDAQRDLQDRLKTKR